jgi:3',5'-cyclic AMP phosphodiesterase CpdA
VTAAHRHGKLFAISDLHVGFPENRRLVEALRPESDADWLIVAGDVGEVFADVEWALATLRRRFAEVVWAPGNHELWTPRHDPVRLTGPQRYERLVQLCRRLGVHTPEDRYPIWEGGGRPVAIAPLFVLYDYTFRPPGTNSAAEALAVAEAAGVVCADEFLLNPAPLAGRAEWCRARVTATEARLAALGHELPTVLVNHFPLIRRPTSVLRYPEFALWCGTVATHDWHLRFRAAAAVYGHLHIPRTIWQDGVPFHEVSWGYPQEWQRRGAPAGQLRQILPASELAVA